MRPRRLSTRILAGQLVVLLVAVIDDLVAALRSRPTSYEAAEARRPAAQAPGFEL